MGGAHLLVQIAENLHPAELTVAERAEHIAEWVRLTGEKTAGASCATSLPDGRGAGPQHQKRGINAAVRELGIDRTEGQRATNLLTPPPDMAQRGDGADNSDARAAAANVRWIPQIRPGGTQACPGREAKAVCARL